MSSQLKSFFAWRTVSALLDEVWFISLALFIANASKNIGEIGQFSSFAATGDLIGFCIFPWLASRFKASSVSVFADVLQAVWMVCVVVLLKIFGASTILLTASALLTGLLYAMWFSSTETLFSKVVKRDAVQSIHRWVAVSYNAGPLAGPALGGLVFSMVGLPGVAILNAISFGGQILSVRKISALEPDPTGAVSFYGTLRGGFKLLSEDRIVQLIMAFPIVNKVLISGFLPFLTYALIQGGLSNRLAGLVIGCFGIGVFVAGVSYKTQNEAEIGKRFKFDFFMAALFLPASILTSYYVFIPYLVAPICLFGGFFVSRCQIQGRSLRQLVVKAEDMPYAISSMGIALRGFAPFSGILFAALFKNYSPPQIAVGLGISVLLAASVFGTLLDHQAQSRLAAIKD